MGATDYVCQSKHMFTSLNTISPLLSETLFTTNKFGFVHFYDNLHIHDVLYIHTFFTNIIYVSKLYNSLNCTLQFTSSHCLIQGIRTLMTIGAVRMHHKLYSFLLPSSQNNFPIDHVPHPHNQLLNSLWHNRLGHTLYETLQHINKVLNLPQLSKSKLPCDVCLHAKKTHIFSR